MTLLLERSGVRPSFNISNFAKVKHTDYQYEALGRNTLIPAADAPNNNGTITLAYNTNDQVTMINQSGATTNFSYDAEGRRLNETSGNTTTTRHYTDGSDNPTWSTPAATATPNTVTKTEIYTPSLGTGLNITTTIQNGSATGSMQLHDLRGNTVTTIDLSTNTATAWCSYDEFGNQDSTNPANTNLINYNTYAGAERATNATGLILMGARVYNPETNQFTSPDPIPGGNENSYTYPNSPLTFCDFSGTHTKPSGETDPNDGKARDLFNILNAWVDNEGHYAAKDPKARNPVLAFPIDERTAHAFGKLAFRGAQKAKYAKGAYRLFGNLFRLEATFRSPMEKSDGKKYANLGIGLRSGQKSTSKGAFEIELHIPVWSRTDVYNGEEEGHF